eukprot:1154742-Pelagomonas_calceolata.AAC.2
MIFFAVAFPFQVLLLWHVPVPRRLPGGVHRGCNKAVRGDHHQGSAPAGREQCLSTREREPGGAICRAVGQLPHGILQMRSGHECLDDCNACDCAGGVLAVVVEGSRSLTGVG